MERAHVRAAAFWFVLLVSVGVVATTASFASMSLVARYGRKIDGGL